MRHCQHDHLVWWLSAVLAGCVVVEGPCTVSDAGVVCKEGGKVHIMKPAHTIDAAGKAADHIIAKISADPNNVDPKMLVPPRSRH